MSFSYGKDDRLVANGSAGMNLEDFDAEEFFRLMFGGEQFEKIIGDFELAKSFKHAISEVIKDAEKKGGDETREEKEEKMRKRLAYAEERSRAREERVQKLANNLMCKVSIFTESIPANPNDEAVQRSLDTFTQLIKLDLPNLLSAPYGDHLLRAIGYIYSSKAKLWLNKFDSQEGHIGKRVVGFGKHFQSSWKERVHVVKETVKTVKCAVEWGQSMSKLAQIADDDAAGEADGTNSQQPFTHHSGHLEYEGYVPPAPSETASASPKKVSTRSSKASQPVAPLSEEDKRKLEADIAAKSMEALWRATKLEIESVEREVCDRVLSDTSCSRETRRRRCLALAKIGELWQNASPSLSSASSSP